MANIVEIEEYEEKNSLIHIRDVVYCKIIEPLLLGTSLGLGFSIGLYFGYRVTYSNKLD